MVGKQVAQLAVSNGATGKFPAATKSLNILDKFVPQEKTGKERKQKVKINKAVKAMQDAFRAYLKKNCSGVFLLSYSTYEAAFRQIELLVPAYNAEDVRDFSMTLAQFQDEERFADRVGTFLAALVNNCKGKEFVIVTRHLSVAITGIGHMNKKNITVDGDAGDWIGEDMEWGRITVNGSVGCVGTGIKDGDIYQRGRQLVKDGKQIAEIENK